MKLVNYHTEYRADLPYPEVDCIKPDRRQAMLLMEGYSGRVSELSTVTQYAYHRIKCERNYRELAQTLDGIFFVETHHLALLGSCINKLGMDPRYYIYLDKKPISWQAEVLNYKKTAKEMIMADLEGEKAAAAYYTKTAGIIGCPKISDLLLRLAEDEKLHIRIFTELYGKYFKS